MEGETECREKLRNVRFKMLEHRLISPLQFHSDTAQTMSSKHARARLCVDAAQYMQMNGAPPRLFDWFILPLFYFDLLFIDLI